MSDIKDWSNTASNNNDTAPDGWPEGMAPSDVNNVGRENMSAVRRWYEDAEWRDFGDTVTYVSGTSFTVSGDLTARYVANRRIRAVGASTGTIYGSIDSSSYSSPNTTVTVTWDSGSLVSEALSVSLSVTPSNDPIPKEAIKGIDQVADPTVDDTITANWEYARGTLGTFETATNDTTWGSNIWSMGVSYKGPDAADGWTPDGSQYGIAWLRSTNANANANAGEGLYVYVSGGLQGAIGVNGVYITGGGAFTGDPQFNTSDPRLKTKFQRIDSGRIVDSISAGRFHWDSDACKQAGFTCSDQYEHFGFNAQDVYQAMGEYAAPIAGFDQDPKNNKKSVSGKQYRTTRSPELLAVLWAEVQSLRSRLKKLEEK